MQTLFRDDYSRRPAAFTLIELILVLFIMCMLTFMTIPMLSQLLKGSKVQQTVSIVSTTLYRARMDAMRTRKLVGVFFGDDLAACTNKPALGVIPPKGKIEIWTVKDNSINNDANDNSACSSTTDPYYPGGNYNPGGWFPYRYPDHLLSSSITFPDGVRILAGWFDHGVGPPQYQFGWPSSAYRGSADGEIKRHTITYSRNGAMPTGNTYWNLLIYDEKTGEHVIMVCGEWLCSSKPRVLPFQLTGLYGVSGKFYPVNKNLDVSLNCEK